MDYVSFIQQMVRKGGPDQSDYDLLTELLHDLARRKRQQELSDLEITQIKDAFGESLSLKTMQGFGLHKPHGYAGDYEMIDRIYTWHKTNIPHLRRWDEYFHSQAGPNAVRNRKAYFIQLMRQLEHNCNVSAAVLNLASGPARDVYEFFSNNNNGHIIFDCVDQDQRAIVYATNLNIAFMENINFYRANVLKFQPSKLYRLIWSAGLFDYFDDKTFVWMLSRMLNYLEYPGEIVIGNFSLENPTRDYMELVGEWFLYHRSPETLKNLALQCGVHPNDIYIGQEPEKVNLFLHIKRGSKFLMDPVSKSDVN